MGKKTYVREETFAELVKSAKQALAYERGERKDYRITQVSSEYLRTTSRKGTPLGSTLRIRQRHKMLPNK